MNIHEYQAKELLKRYGVAVLDGHVAWTPDEAVAAARQAARPGLCGEVADPRRRPRRRPLRRRPERQGRRAPRALDRRGARGRRGDARPHAGHQADRSGRAHGASRLCRGRLRYRPRAVSLAAGRSRQRPRHRHRLHRRRHGDRGGRGAPPGEDPARRDRSGGRHFRLPCAPPGVRPRPDRQAGGGVRRVRAGAIRGRSPAWIARSSRSTRWWSPAPATSWRWMPRSASTTTRCSAIRSWKSCATRRRRTRRNWRPPSTT